MRKQMKTLFGLTAMSLVLFTTSCSDNNGGDDNTSTFVLVQDDLRGEIKDGEVTLRAGETYKLTGALIVSDKATLTIEEGVTIEATKITEARKDVRYIAVGQGGTINVKGTAARPAVMTSTEKTTGAWGGLVICGKAPINKGFPAVAEVSGLNYGGTEANDNSGTIKYLRIEYSGYNYSPEKEFNGLSMFGVGAGTTIEYVQVHEGSDDGFEWFGGTVNGRYLVVTNDAIVPDDLFDWTEGWTGTGEYWYGVRKNDGNRGIEADNNSNDHAATPISSPTIRNLTLVGNETSTGNESQGILMRVGTQGIIDNVVLKGWKTGIEIRNDKTLEYIGGKLLITNVKFEDVATKIAGRSNAHPENVPTAETLAGAYTENAAATGAGAGSDVPNWAKGWTVGL
ncbi:MAG: hypothetical protein Q4G08_05230 [Capnocytophaga sp.]|nr:hypothetical protein [Capnocytophaga sp.]